MTQGVHLDSEKAAYLHNMATPTMLFRRVSRCSLGSTSFWRLSYQTSLNDLAERLETSVLCFGSVPVHPHTSRLLLHRSTWSQPLVYMCDLCSLFLCTIMCQKKSTLFLHSQIVHWLLFFQGFIPHFSTRVHLLGEGTACAEVSLSVLRRERQQSSPRFGSSKARLDLALNACC